jgi:hypothetical protein
MSRAYAIIPDTLCHISNLAALKKALEARNCMRADRLLSIMLLLQTHRRMTAINAATIARSNARSIRLGWWPKGASGIWSLRLTARFAITGSHA